MGRLGGMGARELPELLMLQGHHEHALAQAESRRQWSDVALGMAMEQARLRRRHPAARPPPPIRSASMKAPFDRLRS